MQSFSAINNFIAVVRIIFTFDLWFILLHLLFSLFWFEYLSFFLRVHFLGWLVVNCVLIVGYFAGEDNLFVLLIIVTVRVIFLIWRKIVISQVHLNLCLGKLVVILMCIRKLKIDQLSKETQITFNLLKCASLVGFNFKNVFQNLWRFSIFFVVKGKLIVNIYKCVKNKELFQSGYILLQFKLIPSVVHRGTQV